MIEKLETRQPFETRDAASPFDEEFFLVEGIGFSCLAYRDNEGRWRMAFTNVLLPDFIRILN